MHNQEINQQRRKSIEQGRRLQRTQQGYSGDQTEQDENVNLTNTPNLSTSALSNTEEGDFYQSKGGRLYANKVQPSDYANLFNNGNNKPKRPAAPANEKSQRMEKNNSSVKTYEYSSLTEKTRSLFERSKSPQIAADLDARRKDLRANTSVAPATKPGPGELQESIVIYKQKLDDKSSRSSLFEPPSYLGEENDQFDR